MLGMVSDHPEPATTPNLLLWEALDADDAVLEQVRQLYEATQEPDEQIPWKWIAGATLARKRWRPGAWAPHLVLAGTRLGKRAQSVLGFTYGVHLPGYGGYLSYIGVDPARRRGGAGRRLVEVLVRLFQVDACCEGGELPFVVWESRPPAPGDEAGRRGWEARLGLWQRAGAWWVSGLTFHAVNYHRRKAPPVPLQLFLLPVARPAAEFGAGELRQVAGGLLNEVYRRGPGEVHYDLTLPPDCRPALRPVAESLALIA
jgi:ribosomal protein S18 acetylase RimI-like enzyme